MYSIFFGATQFQNIIWFPPAFKYISFINILYGFFTCCVRKPAFLM